MKYRTISYPRKLDDIIYREAEKSGKSPNKIIREVLEATFGNKNNRFNRDTLTQAELEHDHRTCKICEYRDRIKALEVKFGLS